MSLKRSLQRIGIARPEPRIAKAREAVFRDTLIVPFEELLEKHRGAAIHKGGPIWPDWERQVFPRMCKKGRVREVRPEFDGEPSARVEALAWGGPLVRHFGHQVADFATRLVRTRQSRPDLAIAFAMHQDEDWSSFDDGPRYVGPVLDWLGVGEDRRVLVRQPTLVGELYVAEQAEQIGGPGPNDDYLDALDDLTATRLDGLPALTDPVLYVSRAGMPSTLAGEGYLEEVLTKAGVKTTRPESLSLPAQMHAYHSAEHLVLSEGSALHGLQLTGRLRGSVAVLERRNGQRLAKRNLERRTDALRYVKASRGIVHGVLPSGEPGISIGISVLSAEAAISTFRSVGIDIATGWDARRFAAAIEADITEWLMLPGLVAGHRSAASRSSIVAGLEALDFGSLARAVPGILGPAEASLATSHSCRSK